MAYGYWFNDRTSCWDVLDGRGDLIASFAFEDEAADYIASVEAA